MCVTAETDSLSDLFFVIPVRKNEGSRLRVPPIRWAFDNRLPFAQTDVGNHSVVIHKWAGLPEGSLRNSRGG